MRQFKTGDLLLIYFQIEMNKNNCRIGSQTTSPEKYLNCTQLFENKFYHELQQTNPIKFWNPVIWTLKVILSECQFFIIYNCLRFIHIAEVLVNHSQLCLEGRQEDLQAHHHQERLRLQHHPSHWPRRLVD